MRVNKLEFDRFRNLQAGTLVPCENVNVITGENAQGKTNLLEALWLFTGARSFRGAKDKELIRIGEEECRLSLDFFAAGRDQNAVITVKNKRTAELGGIKLPSAAKLAGVFCGIVFSPAHLSLIKGGPAERRRLVDAAYCQLRPAYVHTLNEYTRILAQRNALCKAQDTSEAADELMELWDRQLAKCGCLIIHARQVYLKRMLPVARKIYEGLSSGKETLWLSYRPTVPITEGMTAAEIAAAFYEQLKASREADRAAGFTTVGPHRDDVEVTVDEKNARSFASQGQQRSAVLAMKLAEATVLEEVTGEKPIALLDDVMSELDTSRQEYILNHLHDWQVFITCCDSTPLFRLIDGREFKMKQGILYS